MRCLRSQYLQQTRASCCSIHCRLHELCQSYLMHDSALFVVMTAAKALGHMALVEMSLRESLKIRSCCFRGPEVAHMYDTESVTR